MSNDSGTPKSRRRRRPEETRIVNSSQISYNDDNYHHKHHNERMRNTHGVSNYLVSVIDACWKPEQQYSRDVFGSTNTKETGRVKMSFKVGLFLLVGMYAYGPSFNGNATQFHLRPPTDEALDSIRVQIPILDFDHNADDIGGWMHVHRFYLPETKIVDIGQIDRGGIKGVVSFGKPRLLRLDDEKDYARNIDTYHRDVKKMHSYNEFNEDIEDRNHTCQRVSWKFDYFPSCNDIHTLDLSHDYDSDAAAKPGDAQTMDSFYISHGYYRDVWVIKDIGLDVKSILKTSRYKHAFDIETMLLTLADALVMEKLTPSPRIVDIYKHCGTAILVEPIPYEVEEVVVPGTGYRKHGELNGTQPLPSENRYTTEEKLDLAISMAESLADLHGFSGGVIVHDDVQLCQWLSKPDGTMKLGDFNRAEVMEFDTTKGEYCKYNNGHAHGNYRAPEEFAAEDLNEQIDVFTMGNNIYTLLTGLWVFYENEDDTIVQQKVKRGELAYIDPRWRNKSFIESELVKVMEKCWVFKAEHRIDIFAVVKYLHWIKREYKERGPGAAVH